MTIELNMNRHFHRVLWQVMDIGFRSGERYVYADELAFLLEQAFIFENEDGSRATFDGSNSWLKDYDRNQDLVDALADHDASSSLDHNQLRAAIANIDPKMAGRFTISDLSQFTDALLVSLSGAPSSEKEGPA